MGLLGRRCNCTKSLLPFQLYIRTGVQIFPDYTEGDAAMTLKDETF